MAVPYPMQWGLGVFDVVSGIIGVVSEISGMIPNAAERGTVVRVAAGLGDNFSGNQPGLNLYDGRGKLIGYTFGTKDKISEGGACDILVPYDDKSRNKENPEYISVVNGGYDALCIAYITVHPPIQDPIVWTGTLGAMCGADWYHSKLWTRSARRIQPKCIWIDRGRDSNIQFEGFGMHIYDFRTSEERAKEYNDNIDLMCKSSPRFRMYEKMISADPIPFFSPGLDYDPDRGMIDASHAAVFDKNRWALRYKGPNINKKLIDSPFIDSGRPIHSRQGFQRRGNSSVFDDLIVSPDHSATELCDSSSSLGPDFVSLEEQLFCDMDIKELWQLCSVSKTDDCFDLGNTTIKAGNDTMDAKKRSVEKEYRKIVYWT